MFAKSYLTVQYTQPLSIKFRDWVCKNTTLEHLFPEFTNIYLRRDTRISLGTLWTTLLRSQRPSSTLVPILSHTNPAISPRSIVLKKTHFVLNISTPFKKAVSSQNEPKWFKYCQALAGLLMWGNLSDDRTGNEIDCCSIDHCWLLNTGQQRNPSSP
jgi:hypothetical protein